MNSGPKWSLRNGSQYQRLCARAGCGAAAVATLRFQSTQRQAWLVELDVNASRTQGDLCQRHAAALVLPRGWELHDERAAGTWTAVGSSDTAAPTAPENGSASRRGRARRKKATAPAEAPDVLPGMGPDVTPAPATAKAETESPAAEVPPATAVAEPVPDEEPEGEDREPPGNGHASRPVPAQFGASDEEDVEEELGEILDARTPLLQRAFRNAKPQSDDESDEDLPPL